MFLQTLVLLRQNGCRPKNNANRLSTKNIDICRERNTQFFQVNRPKLMHANRFLQSNYIRKSSLRIKSTSIRVKVFVIFTLSIQIPPT